MASFLDANLYSLWRECSFCRFGSLNCTLQVNQSMPSLLFFLFQHLSWRKCIKRLILDRSSVAFICVYSCLDMLISVLTAKQQLISHLKCCIYMHGFVHRTNVALPIRIEHVVIHHPKTSSANYENTDNNVNTI